MEQTLPIPLPGQEVTQQLALLSQQMTLLTQHIAQPVTQQPAMRLVQWMEEWFLRKKRNPRGKGERCVRLP